jgi:CheY-like chemotaxis protein
MPNTRKILIVDDDLQLRDALTEQLSLHEEFEAVAAENGSKGVQAARINVSSRSRSSPLSLTTYFLTKISFAAMIASLASRWRRKQNH